MFRFIGKIVSFFMIKLIRFYQLFISPLFPKHVDSIQLVLLIAYRRYRSTDLLKAVT